MEIQRKKQLAVYYRWKDIFRTKFRMFGELITKVNSTLWPNPSITCNFVVQVAGGAWYGAIAHHLNNFRESQSLECLIVRCN